MALPMLMSGMTTKESGGDITAALPGLAAAAGTGGLSAFLPYAGTALGALGGMFGQSQSQQRTPLAEGSTGALGRQSIEQYFPELQRLMSAGPGQQDVQKGLEQQRGLADLLGQYAQGGFLPGAQDWSTARQFASNAFQPQQVAMSQAFQGQQQRTAQLAAQLGRPVNDPILQARLAQEQMQGQERLGASQSAYASQFAQSLPQQRLMYAGQQADVSSQLASQAMANRQALIGLGSNLQQIDNQFRLAGAGLQQTAGGGIGGAISGGLAGYGAFARLGQMFNSPNQSLGQSQVAPSNMGVSSFARAQASTPIQNTFNTPPSYTGMGSINYGMPANYPTPNANVGMSTIFDMLSPNIQQFNRGF